jgi:preprotein translocase subunit SecE
VVDDRDKERDKGQERPSRPVTAAARRERRGSARPAARKDTAPAGEKSAAKGSKAEKAVDKGADKAKARARGKDAGAKPAARGEHKGRPTPSRDRKEARQGLFSRMFRFLREVVAELRKVIWPTRKQMITYTAVVLVFVAFMVALIAVLDIGLSKGVAALFG